MNALVGQDQTSILGSVRVGNGLHQNDFIQLPIHNQKPPSLSYDQNYLMFNFDPGSQGGSDTLFYFLEGLDYNWIYCVQCRQVAYSHLDGGDFVLHAKFGKQGTVVIYPFRIEGNVWHRWWFMPLLLLVLLGILGMMGYFALLYRLRQKIRQEQLVHREKLSSMVDLTSGIAHELQNPLNFVNNFSELSGELIQEAIREFANGDALEATEILADVAMNLQKIHEHGQRASGIVTSMLEHAKPTSGSRTNTDINKLCDDYFRIALHACTENGKQLTTPQIDIQRIVQFDPRVPPIPIVPQDIGRVLQNIFNNACYELKKQGQLPGASMPFIKLVTQKLEDRVIIRIEDNGRGIPTEIKDKIFQPFFTTKPTGQGTGLGLSLSYDIVKAHGGELKVESKEGEGTAFIIRLPIV